MWSTSRPVPESSALGNVLTQARACGAVVDSLDGAREMVAANMELRRYEPQ
jgi:hypothetical protein